MEKMTFLWSDSKIRGAKAPLPPILSPKTLIQKISKTKKSCAKVLTKAHYVTGKRSQKGGTRGERMKEKIKENCKGRRKTSQTG